MVVAEVVDVSDWDVVVIGGGAAGLSGALMLARARRSVLVIDAGAPRNAPADGVHGLLARDGMPPAELLARGRAEVGRTAARSSAARSARSTGTATGSRCPWPTAGRVRARRLLVTTGLVDELPDVPGLRERWGRDVLHCPYCHGWEVRDRAIGVLATGPRAVHQALLFRQWSADVMLFTHRAPAPDPDAGRAAGRARHPGGRRRGGGAGGRRRPADRGAAGRRHGGRPRGVVVAPRMVARAGLLASLGLRPVEHPSGAGEHVPADPTGRTEVPGVWVAGNVTDLIAQVGTAAAAAASAAAQINADLVAEETAPRSPPTGTRSRRRSRRGWPSWHRLLRWVWTRWGVEGTALHRPIRPSG